MLQNRGLILLLGALAMIACADAHSPAEPESFILAPETQSSVLGGIEGLTKADPGFYAHALTRIWGTGVGFNVQAQIKEYTQFGSLLRESFPDEKGANYPDITPYAGQARAYFDPIYVCGRQYEGWHRWQYWNELPWTTPGAVYTDKTQDALPSCNDCEDKESFQVSYDPYDDGGDCGSNYNGGSSTADYDEPYEGASTGGETVDFQTGMPDGGTSACGEKAVLAYVCIEITYEDGSTASECGWATTC